MSFRRFSLAAAFVVTIACAIAIAQSQVTVVLTNGRQYNGTLVYRNGSVGLMTDNGVRSWPQSNVAVIEFTPGQPNPAELSQLPVSTSRGFGGLMTGGRPVVLVLNNGQVVTGTLNAISSDGGQVSLATSNGVNNYLSNDVARLYLNPSAAQRLFESNQGAFGTAGTSGQGGFLSTAKTITLPANEPWADTGIRVRQGQQITMRVSGQIHWGSAPNQVVGPQGGTTNSNTYPVTTSGVGALIARVGNSQPFAVPASGTITAPASGELYLGINDDIFSDNSGNFHVQIAIGG